MNNGYLSIVLHAHLPYVHHPEYEVFFEENWLFEAITECYLPLISMLDSLQINGIDYRLTLSLSPTLITLLRNPLLQKRYLEYLRNKIQLAEQEIIRNQQQPDYLNLAKFYLNRLHNCLGSFQNHYQSDLVSAFIKHQQTGQLELITTAATHGFLPLLNVSELAVRNQIKIGIDTFKANTGINPKGFWLPECAYYPGLEIHLKACGIDYFFVDSSAILASSPQGFSSAVYAPIYCNNGVAVFGRDPASSHQVWSAKEGYPGDADYREYYSDIGYQLDLDYLSPYILDGHTRCTTGIKYHRITGDQLAKQPYKPEIALAKAQQHAVDFVNNRLSQAYTISQTLGQPTHIVAPFDAELFGHWWFEGPNWLEAVFKLLSHEDSQLKPISCSEYLALPLPHHTATPAASSWGENGYSAQWLNDTNAWIYPLLHKAEFELEQLVKDLQGKTLNDLQQRALNQAARSLLLAQASDWPFIMKTGTTVEYAKKSLTDHLARFNYLHDGLRKNRLNERYVSALEIMDDIFPDIDFRDYGG